MSNPKDQQQGQAQEHELELEAETVKDLEPDEESADAIRGGSNDPMCHIQTG